MKTGVWICSICQFLCIRVCLQNHSCNLPTTLCSIFCPNSVAVVRISWQYAGFTDCVSAGTSFKRQWSSVGVAYFPFPTTSDFVMYIHVAMHFRSGFSGSEIRWLRRLRREGSPERLSRSYQLAHWNVATHGDEYTSQNRVLETKPPLIH